MNSKKYFKISGWLFLSIVGLWFTWSISSCGKAAVVSAAGLNIKYEVFNLSPDLGPVNLYINFLIANSTPFTYTYSQGYFTIANLDTAYRYRTPIINGVGGDVVFIRHDTLTRNTQYSLFITGNVANNTLLPIFTVDTATLPAVGRGKVRFVNASPTGTAGIDVYANGSLAFSKIAYPKFTPYIEVPNGSYTFTITATGSATVLKTLPTVSIQDGRLYTLYTSGYTNRADSAAFNAAIITNR
ncbi:MAG: DUF4397 domain-containing protein [Bacteroidota bacterium]|nr:DUF4397 domain-containing protein [Bacteroidota bacterium]